MTELSRVVTSHDKNMTEGADIRTRQGSDGHYGEGVMCGMIPIVVP